MTANGRRNTRAARRKRLDSLQATVEGLQGMHKRAATRAALAGEALARADAALRDRDLELSRVRDGQAQLMAAAGALVMMVDRSSIAHPGPKAYALHPGDAYGGQFYLSVRENLKIGFAGDTASKMRTMHETMHLMRTSAVRDEMNRSMHVKVQLSGGTSSYAVSEYALMHADAGCSSSVSPTSWRSSW